MGCGQSKIHLYPRKSKSKANGKKGGHIDEENDADEEEGHIINETDKEINKDKERIEDEPLCDEQGSPDQTNGEISISLLRAKNLSLLQSQEISSSQQNFFRMLDKKIDDGPDYDSSSETEMALEEARLNALVQHWESASVTASLCSSASRSLQGTPVRQTPMRQGPLLRAQIQQPLNVEMLTQQQQLQQQINSNNSPKRDGRTLLSQNIIHQSYGVAQQGGSSVSGNVIAPGSCLIGTGIPVSGNTMASTGAVRQRPLIPPGGPAGNAPPFIQGNPNISGMLPQHLPMAYYSQAAPAQSYFGEVLHPMQMPQAAPEPRFPPAISVQRLAPQVQRQLRETQELIKDSCPQLYAAGYGSPGPPLRSQQRGNRRPTLDTQFSQELS